MMCIGLKRYIISTRSLVNIVTPTKDYTVNLQYISYHIRLHGDIGITILVHSY